MHRVSRFDEWPVHSCHRTNVAALVLAARLTGIMSTGNERGALPTRTIHSTPPQSYLTLDGNWFVEKRAAFAHPDFHAIRRPWILRRRPT